MKRPVKLFPAKMNLTQAVGLRVYLERKTLGISVDALAKASGVANKTIFNIEAGKANPRVQTIEKLAKALGSRPKIEFEPIPGSSLLRGNRKKDT